MCSKVEESKFTTEGWRCCKCQVINGLSRNMCRVCQQPYCAIKFVNIEPKRYSKHGT